MQGASMLEYAGDISRDSSSSGESASVYLPYTALQRVLALLPHYELAYIRRSSRRLCHTLAEPFVDKLTIDSTNVFTTSAEASAALSPVFHFQHIQALQIITESQTASSYSAIQSELRNLAGIKGWLNVAGPSLRRTLRSLSLASSPSAALNLLQLPCWISLLHVTLQFPSPVPTVKIDKVSQSTAHVLHQLSSIPSLNSLALHRAVVSISDILIDLPGLTRLELHDHVHIDHKPAATTSRGEERLVRLVDLLVTTKLTPEQERKELRPLAASLQTLRLGAMVVNHLATFSALTILEIREHGQSTSDLMQHLQVMSQGLLQLQLTDLMLDPAILVCIAHRFTRLETLKVGGLGRQALPETFSMPSLRTLHCSLRTHPLMPLPRMFPCLVALRIHGSAGRRGPATTSSEPSAWAPGSFSTLTTLSTTHDVLGLTNVVEACSNVAILSTTMNPDMWPSSAQLSAPPHLLLAPMTKLKHLTLTAVTGSSCSVSEPPYYGARRGDASDTDTSEWEEEEEQESEEEGEGEVQADEEEHSSSPPMALMEQPIEQSLLADVVEGVLSCSIQPAAVYHSPVTHLVVKWYESPKLESVTQVAAWMPQLESVCLQHWQTHAVVGGDAGFLQALVVSPKVNVLCCVGCPGVNRAVCGDVERGAGRPALRVECWPMRPGAGSCLVQLLDETSP